jgi:hypothetical protein
MTEMILYFADGCSYFPVDSLSGLANVEQQDTERDFPFLLVVIGFSHDCDLFPLRDI